MFLTAFSDRDEEQIVWETFKPLSWDDFKGKPDKKSNAAAVTFSGISFGIETKADSIQFTIKSTFDCKRSWVNKTLANPYILQHEQLHFMITEIYARRLRMEIKKINPQKSKPMATGKKLYDKLSFESKKYQDNYDRQTDHSRNVFKQKEWDMKLNNELESLKNETDTLIMLW